MLLKNPMLQPSSIKAKGGRVSGGQFNAAANSRNDSRENSEKAIEPSCKHGEKRKGKGGGC